MSQNLTNQEQAEWRELILHELSALQVTNKTIRPRHSYDETDVMIHNAKQQMSNVNVSNFYLTDHKNGHIDWAMTGTLTVKGSPPPPQLNEDYLQPKRVVYDEQRDADRTVTLQSSPSDEDGRERHGEAQCEEKEAQGPTCGVIIWMGTKSAEERESGGEEALMSHSETLQYLLCDSFNHPQFHDEVPSGGKQDNKSDDMLMSHTDTLKYILEEAKADAVEATAYCGIGALLLHDDETKESKQIMETKNVEAEATQILKELVIKSGLIENDIKMAMKASSKNPLQATKTMLNELKMKNELIKQDIEMIKVTKGTDYLISPVEAFDRAVCDYVTSPFDAFNRAVCTDFGPSYDTRNTKQSSSAPTIEWIYKEAGIKSGYGTMQIKEEETLMSHSETIKYLLEDCGIGSIND
jgi:hypothetical protein